MNWYQLLRLIASRSPIEFDLSTGQPLRLAEISKILGCSLERLARRPEVPASLGSYDELDGLYSLRSSFALRCSTTFDLNLEPSNVLVIPGVQAGLRYVQELVRERRQRLCYPAALEFPGAVDNDPGARRSVGGHSLEPIGDRVARPRLDLDGIDWSEVGAVVLSRPHNPTGRLWGRSALAGLAGRASEQNAPLVLDETYALPFAPLTLAEPRPFHAPNVVHLYSFSKVGLAAERVGVVVAAAELIDRIRRALRRNAILASRTGQHLALELVRAFAEDPELGARFGRLYQDRWSLLASHLVRQRDPIPGLTLAKWEGGPFLWCEWCDYPTSDFVCQRLLESGVAVAPAEALVVGGDSAGTPPARCRGLRIGLGVEKSALDEAGIRIAGVLREHLRG